MLPPYSSPLQHYPGFEPRDLAAFDAFRTAGLDPEPGFIVDFLGGERTRCSSLATP